MTPKTAKQTHSQQTIRRNKGNTSPTPPMEDNELLEVGCGKDLSSSADKEPEFDIKERSSSLSGFQTHSQHSATETHEVNDRNKCVDTLRGFDTLISQTKKEIEEIREGCGNKIEDNEEFDLDCGEEFENDEAESGCSFLLCEECRNKLIKAEATLSTWQRAKELAKSQEQKFLKNIPILIKQWANDCLDLQEEPFYCEKELDVLTDKLNTSAKQFGIGEGR